uniref:Uncharacterized protein n=1 Tax=Fusarium oxysporum (strain Fo5176) TaxID=660025 RepID=A0A0D2YFG3_FUSOF
MADSFIREPDGAGCQTQAFLLHTNGDGDRVYGSAVQWCWIAPSWDALRIATFYGPIWGVIAITLAIYIRSGGTIYRKRQQLLKAQASGSGSGGLSYANQSTINNMKTTEVTITREAAGETNAVELQSMGHQASVHVIRDDTRSGESRTAQVTTHTSSTTSQPTVPRPPGRVSNDVYRAAWAYTKVAMLFFAVILITWIPSSANRMYSHIHPKEAEESRSNRRSKLKTMLKSRTEDSESLRELAYPTKSDDGRSV